MLRGAVAASVTPLRAGRLDEPAFGAVVDFLAAGGLDGVLAFGTNGEGVLFSPDERRRGLELFLDASAGRLQVAAHCGAQTTADTVALAAHAAEAGADAVAVIAPPYFVLDEAAQLAHFLAAAQACAPVPFYVYEFARTSGYAVALDVLHRLREAAPNVAGMKVSDAPWDAFATYLLPGWDVFVGPEALIHSGLVGGAVGAVSALASGFPEEVAAVVRTPTADGAARLAELRATIERFPRQSALKHAARRRGVEVREEVRPPLRALTAEEAAALDAALDALGA